MEEFQKGSQQKQSGSIVQIPVGKPDSLLEVGARAAERAEQELVRRVLGETGGNRKLAARRLNICYKALLNKLKRWSAPQTLVSDAA